MRVCLVSTYPPKRCGIATFARDLRAGLLGGDSPASVSVAAIGAPPAGERHPPEVIVEIARDDLDGYVAAARRIDREAYDLVCVQHEFGIFGGDDGRHVVTLLEALATPTATSLHTVLATPTAGQHATLQAVARASNRLVVHSDIARQLLGSVYGIDGAKVAIIAHGVPDVPFESPDRAKAELGLSGRRVLLTFGLLSRNKGIEVVLEALPEVVAEHPDLLYVVLGATHPEVRRHEGEAYRDDLRRTVAALGLEKHVELRDGFVPLEVLTEYLAACDVYVTPYRARDQIVSGTLAYAVGMGRAVLSTPYRYAEELLAEGRGRLVPFDDVEAMARGLAAYLDDDAGRERTRALAWAHGRTMTWPEVGRRHLELFEVLRRQATGSVTAPVESAAVPDLSAVNLAHVLRLADDTGVLQHATWQTPARRHGYATDDVARALVLAVRHRAWAGSAELDGMARTSLAYLADAQRDDGRFANLMGYDRVWRDDLGTEDTLGQSVWGLGTAVAAGAEEPLRGHAEVLLRRALAPAAGLQYPRAVAYAITGLCAALEVHPGDRALLVPITTLADRLVARFESCSDDGWRWIGDEVTYANAKLPHALLLAGAATAERRYLEIGFEALDFLAALSLTDGIFDPVGNEGWYRRGQPRARFGQQPLEAAYTIEAALCAAAMSRGGQAARYRGLARAAAAWFSGRNRLGVVLYDPATGACADGLDAGGASRNAGAESTITTLLGLIAADAGGLGRLADDLPSG